MCIMSGIIKFVPYTVGGAIVGFVIGLILSMIITTLNGQNPWDESQPLQTYTTVIVPLFFVGGAVWGANHAFR